jgi:hypothetical protein
MAKNLSAEASVKADSQLTGLDKLGVRSSWFRNPRRSVAEFLTSLIYIRGNGSALKIIEKAKL